MPGRMVVNAALYASMVTSLALCIKANSVLVLYILQPAVIGVASTMSKPVANFFTPSAIKNLTRSSIPILLCLTPLSLITATITA